MTSQHESAPLCCLISAQVNDDEREDIVQTFWWTIGKWQTTAQQHPTAVQKHASDPKMVRVKAAVRLRAFKSALVIQKSFMRNAKRACLWSNRSHRRAQVHWCSLFVGQTI
jgi:hypothetical protein